MSKTSDNFPPAGPELDALIAEKVFRWKWNIRNGVCYAEHDCFNAADCWPEFLPSTSIADAWTVVEKLIELFEGDIHIEHLGRWGVSTCRGIGAWLDFTEGDTAPLAICYAALRAVK